MFNNKPQFYRRFIKTIMFKMTFIAKVLKKI